MSELVERLEKAAAFGAVSTDMRALLREAAAALSRLEQWKAEALEVERSWDAQAVAKLLNLKPGDDIRAGIKPGIERLVEALQEIDANTPTQFTVEVFAKEPALKARPDFLLGQVGLANIGDIARAALGKVISSDHDDGEGNAL